MVTAHNWEWTSTHERHGTLSLVYTRWDRANHWAPTALPLIRLPCAVCTVYQLLFFPVQASSQVQGLLTTNAASEQSSKYCKDLELRAAAPAVHSLLNQAHWDTKHCSLGTADLLGQEEPYKLQACLFLSMVSLRREKPSSFWFCNNIHFLI